MRLGPGDVHAVITQHTIKLAEDHIGCGGRIVLLAGNHNGRRQLTRADFRGPGQAGGQQVVAGIGTREGVAIVEPTDDFGAAITHILRGEFGFFHREYGHITREHRTDTAGGAGSATSSGLRGHHIANAIVLQNRRGGGVVLLAFHKEVAIDEKRRDRGGDGFGVVRDRVVATVSAPKRQARHRHHLARSHIFRIEGRRAVDIIHHITTDDTTCQGGNNRRLRGGVVHPVDSSDRAGEGFFVHRLGPLRGGARQILRRTLVNRLDLVASGRQLSGSSGRHPARTRHRRKQHAVVIELDIAGRHPCGRAHRGGESKEVTVGGGAG